MLNILRDQVLENLVLEKSSSKIYLQHVFSYNTIIDVQVTLISEMFFYTSSQVYFIVITY